MEPALLGLVALAPLPFGANRPWGVSLAAALTALLLIWSAASALRKGTGFAVAPARLKLPLTLFGMVCLYIVLQLLPGLSDDPAAYWRLPRDILDLDPVNSININPDLGWAALMRLLMVGGVFWLSLQAFRPVEAADRAMLVMAMAASAYALYGIGAFASGNRYLLWYAKWTSLDSASGTFVNRNHFATYVALGLLCAVACLARRWPRIAAAYRRGGLRDAESKAGLSTFWLVAAIPTDLAALLLSHSRGGFIATVIALPVFLLGAGRAVTTGRRMVVWGALCVLILSLGWMAAFGTGLRERLGRGLEMTELEYRVPAYRMTLQAIADAPWTGFGYGSFEDGLKPYRAPPLDVYFDHAHNDYLENALELGVPMAICFFVVPLAIALRCGAALRRQHGTRLYAWTAACATLLVGLHAALDFSLQIPAVAMFYASLLGCGCAQSWGPTVDTSSASAGRCA